MTFELNEKSSEIDPRRKKLFTVIAQDIKNKLNSVLEEKPDSQLGPEIYKETLSQIYEKFKSLWPEYNDEIETMFTSLVNSEYADGEEFKNVTTETLVGFSLKYFDYSQIEEISRRDRKMLNRLVEYVIEEDEVALHIPLTLLENGIELRTLFIEALRELAQRMKQDPDLQNINKITAASWMIYRLPDKYLEAIGFSNIERYEKDATGSAEMTREVLLEKYGSL
jgi:hypothetical protein